jgi:hypothetical protein
MTATSLLQFYLHHDPDALRMELSGSLSGADVESVFHAWHIEIDRDPFRPFIADISFVTEADEYGLALLTIWHRSGAQIVARSDEARAIAEPILRQPIERAAPKRRWFRRLSCLASDV